MRACRLQFAGLALTAAALTGCQGVMGSGQYAQVRFIEASPDTPAVDLSQNGTPVLYGVGFGTASSYIPLSPGTYTYAAHTAALHQQLAKTAATLAPGAQYTVLVGNTAAELSMTLLKDQAAAAPAGEIALRFLDQATRSGAVDLYLVPEGKRLTAASTAVATNISLGNAPAYLDVPAGTYSVVALPTGAAPGSAVPPLYSGTQLDYAAGSAHTILLLDAASAGSALQLLVADDYDPSAA